MRLVPSALSLALMGSALVVGQATKDLPGSASGASTGPAVRFDNRVTVYRGATIEPVYNVKLAAKVTGTIIKVAVKEGQFVKADEVLVQLDDSIARAELEAKQLAAKNDTAIRQSAKKVEEYQVRVEKEEQAYRRGASTEQDVRLNRVQLALETEILKGKEYDQKIAQQDAFASAEKVRQHQLRAPSMATLTRSSRTWVMVCRRAKWWFDWFKPIVSRFATKCRSAMPPVFKRA